MSGRLTPIPDDALVLALAAKAQVFESDPAVRRATELAGANALAKATVGKYSTVSAVAFRAENVIDHIFGPSK
jgi:hypothetical protein